MNTTIREVINEIEGLAFGPSQIWSEKDKVFFEDRYSKIISLMPRINKKDVGLEIGLFWGIMAFLIKKFFHPDKLYTLEHPIIYKQFTKKYLKTLKENDIILKPCDLHLGTLPWPDNFFDFIIFSELMEHLIPADIPIIIREIKRVLKKNGWLIVTTPNIASLIKRVNLLRGKNPIEFDLRKHQDATYGHIREYTMRELVTILQDQNFKIINKDYFMIDVKRGLFTQIENLIAKFIPPFANQLIILAKKF